MRLIHDKVTFYHWFKYFAAGFSRDFMAYQAEQTKSEEKIK